MNRIKIVGKDVIIVSVEDGEITICIIFDIQYTNNLNIIYIYNLIM